MAKELKTLKVFGALLYVIVVLILNAIACQTLWNWFVIDYFKVAPIGIFQALGLFLIISFATIGNRKEIKPEFLVEKSNTEKWTKPVITPLVYLAVGFLFKIFL